jgi:hypothetical protein
MKTPKPIQELNGVSKTRGELVLRHLEAKTDDGITEVRERIECELVDKFLDELDHKIRDTLRTAGR